MIYINLSLMLVTMISQMSHGVGVSWLYLIFLSTWFGLRLVLKYLGSAQLRPSASSSNCSETNVIVLPGMVKGSIQVNGLLFKIPAIVKQSIQVIKR